MSDKFQKIVSTDPLREITRTFTIQLKVKNDGCSLAFFADKFMAIDANEKLFEIGCADLQQWLDIIDVEMWRLEGEAELNDEDDDPLYHGQFDQLP